MASYTQEFKVQSVEKALSRRTDQTLNSVADDLHIERDGVFTPFQTFASNELISPFQRMIVTTQRNLNIKNNLLSVTYARSVCNRDVTFKPTWMYLRRLLE